MRLGLKDKKATLDLAEQVRANATAPARARRFSLDPRVWLGALALSGSIAAERRTLPRDPTPADRKSFLPRDLMLSFLQARHDETRAEGGTPAPGAPVTAWTVTGAEFAEGVSASTGFDYHWATRFLAELTVHIVRRIGFRLPAGDPAVQPLAADARLVLVGDWGTGEGVALEVAAQMRKEIADAGDREVHVVHLGDVYYAGTRWEAQHRFLDHWPVPPEDATRVRSWCLNGNHDMYAAGEGLFGVILADPRFAGQRTEAGAPTSEFHLRNDAWDVVGLDTSFRFRIRDVRGGTGFLTGRQQRRLADRTSLPGRRVMLLSHHQPFTRTGPGPTGVVDVGNLLAATAGLRRTKGVAAWFWGHEHRLYAYGARAGVRYGTCLGHGAVLETPMAADEAGPGEAEYPATFTDADGDRWRMPGFAVVDLDGPTATVRYLDKDGRQWREPDVLAPES